jgi:hypothetical protein
MNFVDYQQRVQGMIGAGIAFGSVEDEIDAAYLPDAEKAALWLLAWSHQPRRAQRRMVHETIAALTAQT